MPTSTEGFQIVSMEEVAGELDMVTSGARNLNSITLDQREKAKNNISHTDNKIPIAGLKGLDNMKFPDT